MRRVNAVGLGGDLILATKKKNKFIGERLRSRMYNMESCPEPDVSSLPPHWLRAHLKHCNNLEIQSVDLLIQNVPSLAKCSNDQLPSASN